MVLLHPRKRGSQPKGFGEVAGGADPLEKRRAGRRVPSFGDVARDYLARHVAAKRKPRTLEGYETLLRLHILPVVGAMRVTDVRRWHVSQLHSGIASPGAANRALRLVSAIWNFAEREFDDLELGRNPAKGIALNRETGRERFLSADELERLGEALDRAATIGLPYDIDETKPSAKHAPKRENRIRQIDPFGVGAIRLLLLTGARLREILNAKWTYIDAGRGLLNLPDSKTGAKHIVLSRAALGILDGLPRFEGCEFIFPGRSGHMPRTDLKGPWRAVTQAAGLDGLRLHDLRHSFASVGASGGLGLPVIGKLLGHSTPR
jgi:integrase